MTIHCGYKLSTVISHTQFASQHLLFWSSIYTKFAVRLTGINPGIIAVQKENDSQPVESIESQQINQSHQSTTEPSVITIHDSQYQPEEKILDQFDKSLPQRRFCNYCQILQPFRTKHCKLCKACVAKFDHHCFWIGFVIRRLRR